MSVSHFPCLSDFSPQSRSYSVCFSYFTFFTVSRHIQGPTLCVSYFARFSPFLAIFLVLLYEYFIFLVCLFSRHITGKRCFYHICYVFQLSRQNPGRTVCISRFSRFSLFLAVFHVQQCVFLIFHIFRFSLHTPGPTVCISHFHLFQCFSPYSMSDSVCT